MSKADARVMAELLSRFAWREGDTATRLRKVEDRARLRAQGVAYTGDPALDRAVAKLAKRIRKASKA